MSRIMMILIGVLTWVCGLVKLCVDLVLLAVRILVSPVMLVGLMGFGFMRRSEDLFRLYRNWVGFSTDEIDAELDKDIKVKEGIFYTGDGLGCPTDGGKCVPASKKAREN